MEVIKFENGIKVNNKLKQIKKIKTHLPNEYLHGGKKNTKK